MSASAGASAGTVHGSVVAAVAGAAATAYGLPSGAGISVGAGRPRGRAQAHRVAPEQVQRLGPRDVLLEVLLGIPPVELLEVEHRPQSVVVAELLVAGQVVVPHREPRPVHLAVEVGRGEGAGVVVPRRGRG